MHSTYELWSRYVSRIRNFNTYWRWAARYAARLGLKGYSPSYFRSMRSAQIIFQINNTKRIHFRLLRNVFIFTEHHERIIEYRRFINKHEYIYVSGKLGAHPEYINTYYWVIDSRNAGLMNLGEALQNHTLPRKFLRERFLRR